MKRSTIEKIEGFVRERDWEQFHNAKDLAISLALEAGELLENFQWRTSEEALAERQEDLCDELADVLIYAVLLSRKLNVDLDQIVLQKIQKNGKKYPVDQAFGRRNKYTELKKKDVEPQVAVQPCCDPLSIEHLKRTIEADIMLGDIVKLIDDSTRSVLKKEYPDERLRLWGTKANRSLKEWENLREGAVVLFYAGRAGGSKFIYQAEVVHVVRNAELAHFLWGSDDQGATWECIYFLKGLKHVDIDLSEYNKVMGYDEGNVVQGFRVQPLERSLILRQAFKL